MDARALEHHYHHGDLPNQLRRVAAELIAERGAAGFSLREVARRAGVSHAAPAHHFNDATGLLTSVAIEGLTALRTATSAAAMGIDDPVDRLAAIARAYVEVARSNPGHCAVLFRHDLVDPTDEEYQRAGEAAYDVLRSAVRDIAEADNSTLDVETGARLCWATMQGTVQLHPTMVRMAEELPATPFVPDLGDLAEIFAHLMVTGLGGCEA